MRDGRWTLSAESVTAAAAVVTALIAALLEDLAVTILCQSIYGDEFRVMYTGA